MPPELRRVLHRRSALESILTVLNEGERSESCPWKTKQAGAFPPVSQHAMGRGEGRRVALEPGVAASGKRAVVALAAVYFGALSMKFLKAIYFSARSPPAP